MGKITKGKYGYIEFKTSDDYWAEPEIRKPTVEERLWILCNLLEDYSGLPIRVNKLADLFGVSTRTMQKHLLWLEEKCEVIRRVGNYRKSGQQRANIIEYIGPRLWRAENDFTIKNLFDPNNPCGFRDWHWERYKFIPYKNLGDVQHEIDTDKYIELMERRVAVNRKNNALRRLFDLDEK